MPTFPLEPRRVPLVETPYRRIATPIPHPEAVPLLERLHAAEALPMQGQPPILWDRAEGFLVHDRWGNRWIDWTSGVLVANAGHGAPRVADAIREQAAKPLLTTFCFANEPRLSLAEKLRALAPPPLDKIFFLTTGSETIECAVKLCRTRGIQVGGPSKTTIVSFTNAFHGRTLGAQQTGGTPPLKDWIVNLDPGFVQVPFPDGYRCRDTSFALFERSLREQGVDFDDVAGVVVESFQGGDSSFAPARYMQRLRAWCGERRALLACDEIQAGFGRTGSFWGFEQYGIVPDLACFGKGASSSLPLSAVLGRADVMDLYAPSAMTSTHAGNPVCCAAALAALETILDQDLVTNARNVGARLQQRLREVGDDFDEIAAVMGRGMVASLLIEDPETSQPDRGLAFDIVRRSLEKGVLMFAPVGPGGGSVKIAPPLIMTADAVDDSVAGLREAVAEAVEARRSGQRFFTD